MRDRGRMVSSQGYGENDAARIANDGRSVERRSGGRWMECYRSAHGEIVELILEDHGGVTAILSNGRKDENVVYL